MTDTMTKLNEIEEALKLAKIWISPHHAHTITKALTQLAALREASDDLIIMTQGLLEAYEKKMPWYAIEGRTENVLVAIQNLQKAAAQTTEKPNDEI